MEPLGLTNPRVQRLRRLLGRRSARSDDGAFVVEGGGLLAEAVTAGWQVEVQFVAPGGTPVDAPVNTACLRAPRARCPAMPAQNDSDIVQSPDRCDSREGW